LIQYSRIWISDVRAIKPQTFDEPRVGLGMKKNVKMLIGFN
jgi:hypothetical protein